MHFKKLFAGAVKTFTTALEISFLPTFRPKEIQLKLQCNNNA